MTLVIDRTNNEVRDKSDGAVVAEINGPPHHNPADAIEAVKAQLPNDDASVSVQDLKWILDAASGDVEWAETAGNK